MNVVNEIIDETITQTRHMDECAIAVFETLKQMVTPDVGIAILLDMATQLLIRNGVNRTDFLNAAANAFDASFKDISAETQVDEPV